MRILQVINGLEVAGAEVLVTDLAKGLRRRGCDVNVAVLASRGTHLERELEAAGIGVVCSARFGVRSPLHVGALKKMFAGYDVIHAHLFPAQLWVALAGGGARLVTTEHGSDNNRRHSTRILREIDRRMYARYDSIVCNSDATRDALAEWVPAAKSRMTVIPNGIDVGKFANAVPVSRDVLNHTGGAIAVFVGRFEPQKDHATVLRALVRVPFLTMVFIGDGYLRASIERLAQDLGIADRTIFLGRRDDVGSVLKAADFYVHSCPFDGFGLAALEAMAAGLPVIASDVPGLSGVVGDAGILVPSGDDAAFASAMQLLISSATLRTQLSAKAAVRARQFSIDTTVERHIELYRALASRPVVHAFTAS